MMEIKEKSQKDWLDVVEFFSFLAMILGLILGWLTQFLLLPFTVVSLAVIILQISRLRGERLTRKRLTHLSRQLQRLSQDVENLENGENSVNLANLPAYPNPNTAATASLQQLEQSLDQVLNYLQQQAIAERLEQLERRYQRLSQEPENPPPGNPSLEVEPAPPPPLEEMPVRLRVASDQSHPIASLQICHQIKAHTNAVSSLAISEDGRFFVSASWDQSLKIWETDSGHLLSTAIAHSQGILSTVFLACGAELEDCRLASGSFDQTLKFWRIKGRSRHQYELDLERTLTAHTGSVYQLALAARQQLLISSSYDQTLKQWDSQRGVLEKSCLDPLGAIEAIAVQEEREMIAAGGGDGTVTLWQLGTGKKLGHLVGNISSVKALAINRSGHWIAAACIDGTIKLWQLALPLAPDLRLHPQQQLLAHQGAVTSLCFTRSGQLLSSGSDGGIQLWQPEQSEAIAVLVEPSPFVGQKDIALCLTLSRDEQFLLSGHADGTVCIWRFSDPNP